MIGDEEMWREAIARQDETIRETRRFVRYLGWLIAASMVNVALIIVAIVMALRGVSACE